jgi:glycosyltransferase involved in cell wall biosynthesis
MQQPATGYVVSLKYAPWHYAFMTGFVRQCEAKSNGSVKLMISEAYGWMLPKDQHHDVAFLGVSNSTASMLLDCVKFVMFRWIVVLRLLLTERPQFVYFVNPHPLNPMISLLTKFAVPNCKVLTHVHEPKANQTANTLGWRTYETLTQAIQTWGIWCSDEIVVSSKRACVAVRSNKVHVVPLLCEDFASSHAGHRRYITYIGSARRQRGIDRFLQFAEYCFQKSIDLQFQIVTKDDISIFLNEIDSRVREQLKIVNKLYISNEEIADALSESIACCVLYTTEMMQSGVVPVALMAGTPVIVTPFSGLTEFVTDGTDSIVLSSGMTNDEILRAVIQIRNNLALMSQSARQTFESTFHERNWHSYLSQVFSFIEPSLTART